MKDSLQNCQNIQEWYLKQKNENKNIMYLKRVHDICEIN